MTVAKLAGLLVLALCPLSNNMAADVDEVSDEVIVVGRQPGPPLWKVSSGGRVLWIFPYLEWIPKGMLWDSTRVARVIGQSQELLGMPAFDMNYAPALVLNPLNIWRGTRLVNRLDRYPDGGTLQEHLPPELYARYAALQARYFPRERAYAYMRPREVGGRMMHIIREAEGLVDGGDIPATIRRLARNRGLTRTDISIDVNIDDTYRVHAARLEALVESFPPDVEHACFEEQVRNMEEIDDAKELASGWAQGYIDGFRTSAFYDISLAFGASQTCDALFLGSASPERDNMARASARLNQAWLDAAQTALATNASTFAILPINELLAEQGLLSKLKAMGYEVREP